MTPDSNQIGLAVRKNDTEFNINITPPPQTTLINHCCYVYCIVQGVPINMSMKRRLENGFRFPPVNKCVKIKTNVL